MTDWNDKYSTPWYKYQSYIKYVSLSDDLTHIGGSAFSDCSSLTSITIGKKLASIGKDAFSNCSNLAAVHISDLVAWCNIEYDKSWGSTGSIPLIYAHNLYLNGELVTELVIPDEVTSLNASAFHGCTNLTSVVIPQHVTSIGSSAFYGCNKLSSITIGKNVTSIGLYVFYGCTNLHSVIWNAKNCESPTKYENALFYNIFNQITSLTFGEEVETIPNYLAYKTNITSIELPNSVTSIGNYAFYDCGSATSIIIPKNLTSIGENAFSGCSASTSVVWNAKNCVNRGGFGSQVESFVFGNEVESIPESCCQGMNQLTSITIPSTVTSIGKFAFQGCTGLTSIEIPDRVTDIGDYAFRECTYLYDVKIGNGVTNIGESAFKDCSYMLNLEIGNKVTSIGNYAFYNCKYLSEITLPNSLISIGTNAFQNCEWLTFLTIPENVTSIGKDAFYKCNYLTSLVWKAKNCADLASYWTSTDASYHYPFPSTVTSVTIGDKVQRIPDRLCYGMEKLTSITIPSSVTSIGGNTFNGCNLLTAVYISDLAAWCKVSFDAVSLSSHNLYLNGNILTELVIPENVARIGRGAFANCPRITSVQIPQNVTSIEDYAFSNCSAIDTIFVQSDNPASLGTDVFPNTAKIKVNCDARETYLNNTQWNLYNIVKECVNEETPALPTYYTIRFLNYDDSELQSSQVQDGEIPVYNGANPTRPDDENYTYTFKGWSPVIVAAAADADYTAQYEATQKPIISEYACGDNLTWEVINNALIISGTGAMWNYEPAGYENAAPWGTDITSVTLPNGLTHIGTYAFAGCKITSIVIPETVKIIRSGACFSCSKLKEVFIPASVTNMGDFVFELCTGLAKVSVDQNNKYYCDIDGVLLNKDKTKLIQYPIGSTLKEYSIPSGVTSIQSAAFESCKLTSVVIPATVTSIADYAFYSALGIKQISCEATTPPSLGILVFENMSLPSIKLFVPVESITQYSAADTWKSFNIQPIQAVEVAVTEIEAQPTSNSVIIEWPKVTEATVYTIEIRTDSELFCTLTFNELGQLMGLVFAKFAHKDEHNSHVRTANQTATGWQYTINGLNPDTRYTYSVVAKKSASDTEPLYSQSLSFSTKQTPTVIDPIVNRQSSNHKLIINGQLLILHGDQIYTVTGQEVK